ncbi:MAG TPA: VOC family protein [Pyrinomonadaceae bacterium]|jgi:catechol 2,3-dioxygenase-like lactoylglutathione lyase family enzyme
MPESWPEDLPVAQVRVARPTARLHEVVRFYREGLGLEEIGSFSGHAGYSGVMLGLPGHSYHLEFTEHEEQAGCAAPTKDNLLVFYVPDAEAIDRVAARLKALGHEPVPPENPYWGEKGLTFEDPEGWRIVLMNTGGI